MKQFILLLLISTSMSYTLNAQKTYEIVPDAEAGHFLKGIISREAITADTSFKWWEENYKAATNAKALAPRFAKYRDSIQLVLFMGTWCGDSHFIVPRLFALFDQSAFPTDHLTIIGTDRQKKTTGNLSDAFGIKNVPTVLVLKNGKEIGRIVEYGSKGEPDKELVEIVERN